MQVLLAANVENVNDIRFPVIASPKLDGIRAVTGPVSMQSRSAKAIPNFYVQDKLSKCLGLKLDGELIVGEPTHPLCYTMTSSGIMTRAGTPDFKYHVFDCFDDMGIGFAYRYEQLIGRVLKLKDPRIVVVDHREFMNLESLMEYEAEQVRLGYEGIMIRSPGGIYKQGRSTMKEGILCKVKRFVDTEAVVVGYKERLHNANEATINALGYTDRSGHKDNLIPMDTLGAVVLRHPDFEETFDCGSGFTDSQRAEAWSRRFDDLVGSVATFKYQSSGVKDKPRFPIFLRWRKPE
jgi:DNA ligase-1